MKKVLEEREIKPSSNAWEKLSEKLDATAPRQKKKEYFRYVIAAGFVGILFASIFYFTVGNTEKITELEVVDTNPEAIETKIDTKIVEGKNSGDSIVENENTQQLPKNAVHKMAENQIPEVRDDVVLVDESDSVIDTTIEKPSTSNDFKEQLIDTKILEIVATVDSLEQNNMALTDAEVDDLLRNAQKEIFRDKLFEQSESVDALVLLTEVENELDQSFRDQIFDSLKEGFLKARTAVADRNK